MYMQKYHVDGSFGNKVQNIKIIDGNGEILDLNLSGNNENSKNFGQQLVEWNDWCNS